MRSKKFSLRERLYSFSFAFTGLKQLFKTEHNAWIHLAVAAIVLIGCIVYDVNNLEKMALVFAIAFVFVAEIFNTAIEKMMDFISTNKNPKVALIKDLSAAAVLVASIAAAIIGCLIFLPKVF